MSRKKNAVLEEKRADSPLSNMVDDATAFIEKHSRAVHLKKKRYAKDDELSSFPQYAKNLKLMRRAKGYTLYDLARMTGLSPSYLSRIESGDRRLNTEVIAKLSLCLGCEPKAFFETSEGEQSSHQDGFQKNLPVYRIVSAGLNVEDNDKPIIVFDEPMEYSFRPFKLCSSERGFGVYAIDDIYFKSGSMLYFDEVSCDIHDIVLLVEDNYGVVMGRVSSLSKESVVLDVNQESRSWSLQAIKFLFRLVSVDFA